MEPAKESEVEIRSFSTTRRPRAAARKVAVRLAVFAIALFASLTCRAEEAAQKPLIEAITVDPGATCLDGLTLVEHIKKWLGRDQVDKRIHVEVRGSSYVPNDAMFILTKGEGEPTYRYFKSAPSQCYEFHSALGLSIAMAIDAAWIEPKIEFPEEAPEKKNAGRWALSLLGLRTAGLLTDFSWGCAIGAEVGLLQWLDLRLGAIFTYLGNEQLREQGEGKYDTLLIAGRLDLCGGDQTRGGGMRWRGCLGAMSGPFYTRGRLSPPNKNKSQTKPWAATVFGAEIAVSLIDALAIGAEADLLLPWWSREIVIKNTDGSPAVSATLPRVGVIFAMGPVFQF